MLMLPGKTAWGKLSRISRRQALVSASGEEKEKEVVRRGSETHEHGLGFEVNAPEFFHALLDVIFQCQDVRGSGFSTVDDGKSVFAGNTDSAATIAFAKARVLHQPGG